MARNALLAVLITAALWLSGCTNPALVRVQPWDRGTLADETMNPGRDPLSAGQLDHVYFSREAASGGKAVGGAAADATDQATT